jgi:predicted acylesterase/phospholipase RssA/CRP-like cAMP-binding protein
MNSVLPNPLFPIFGHLPSEATQALSASLEEKCLRAGEVLFCQGEPGDAFYIVTSGKLRIHLRQPDGTDTRIKDLGPGEYVGEMALLTGQPRTATVTADQDTELLRLPKSAFDRLAEDHPSLISELARELLPRFQQTRTHLILTDFFGPLDEALLCDLQEKLEWRRLDCGEVLCQQCEPGNEMYIIVQGRVRITGQEGGTQRNLGELGAGESLGEFALLAESGTPESRRSATAYAIRSTDVIVITRSVFENLLRQSPQIMLRLTRRIIQRMLATQSVTPRASSMVITVISVGSAQTPSQEPGEFTRHLADAFRSIGTTLALDPSRFDQLYGKAGAAQTPLDHPASLMINAWLDERESENEYVIYETPLPVNPAGRLLPWTQRCVEDADIVLLVGNSGADSALTAIEAGLLTAKTRARAELVLLHPAGCQVPSGTAAWLAPRRSGTFPVQAHHHIRLGHPADFRRLARRISGRPIGLTLGGGGARGWAHIGVIRALEEANLEVDWVGGASMGAIIAAGYALDWPVERMRQLALSFSDPKRLLDYTFPYASITSTQRITAIFQELFGESTIEDTWRPYFCVSANLTRGEEQVHSSGPLWKTLRASMAFPAIFAPMLEAGCVLIDGGAANNLPIDRMREMCPTGTVIGVDLVTSSPVSREYQFGPSLSGWQALLARVNPVGRKVTAPTVLDIVAGIVYSNDRYRLKEVRHCADLLIQVPVEAYGLLEFDKYPQIIESGYRAAKEQLEGFGGGKT